MWHLSVDVDIFVNIITWVFDWWERWGYVSRNRKVRESKRGAAQRKVGGIWTPYDGDKSRTIVVASRSLGFVRSSYRNTWNTNQNQKSHNISTDRSFCELVKDDVHQQYWLSYLFQERSGEARSCAEKGLWTQCGDYWHLNTQTISSRYSSCSLMTLNLLKAYY